jgi:shikimate kinase
MAKQSTVGRVTVGPAIAVAIAVRIVDLDSYLPQLAIEPISGS